MSEVARLRRELDEARAEIEDLRWRWRLIETGPPGEPRVVETPCGRELTLTVRERTIWRGLAAASPCVVSHDYLLDAACGLRPEADWPEPPTIKVTVCKLRRKLRAAGAASRIETVWGVGYRLVGPEEGAA